MPKNLVLIRHGQSEGNIVMEALKRGDKTLYTKEFKERHDSDYRLSLKGIEQAKITGSYINERFGQGFFDVGFVSSYKRALETASYIDINWQIRSDITERDWGYLGTISPDEREEEFPGWKKQKEENPFYWRPQGGERMADTCNRSRIIIDTLNRQHSKENVIMVCHGEFMWALRILLERINPIEYKVLDQSKDKLDRMHNCKVIHYTREDPSTKVECDKLEWMRSVCPWDTTKSRNTWELIRRSKLYSPKELKEICESTSRLFPDI